MPNLPDDVSRLVLLAPQVVIPHDELQLQRSLPPRDAMGGGEDVLQQDA